MIRYVLPLAFLNALILAWFHRFKKREIAVNTLNQYATVTRQHIRELGRIPITATSADDPTLKVLGHFIRLCCEIVTFLSPHCMSALR
jgi:hypothetical protein